MSLSSPGPLARSPTRFYVFNGVVTVAVLGFLVWLLHVREGGGESASLSFLPAVNASLNALSAALLTAGWLSARRGRLRAHRYFMVAALASSALFLACYVAYHYAHGDTKFQGPMALRAFYLGVLATHVVLSMAVPPLALSAVYFAVRGAFERHKRVTRWALPIWLYVSVTGVAIFFLLRLR